MSDLFPPIFVINLPGDLERREKMKERLDLLGHPYRFVEAVDGRQLDVSTVGCYDRARRRRYFGRDLKPGEIGCLLSHRKVCAMIQEEQLPVALVLEDDAVFTSEFSDVVLALVKSAVPWDIIRFVGSEKIYRRGFRRISPLVDRHWLVRLPTTPGGSHAYLIRLHAAKVLGRKLDRAWLPMDALQGSSWYTGLETLAVYPTPANQNVLESSSIGNERFDKTSELTGLPRLLFPLNRFGFKLVESLGKKYRFWSAWWRDRRYLSPE